MTHFLLHSENECQQSLNDFWSCTSGNEGIAWIYEIITVQSTALVLLNTEHKRPNIDSKINDVATSKVIKRNFWTLIMSFWWSTIIKQPNQEHYINQQTEPLDNPLTTCPILTGWDVSIEAYVNWQFRCIDNTDVVFGDRLVPTWTRTRHAGPDRLLALTLCAELKW